MGDWGNSPSINSGMIKHYCGKIPKLLTTFQSKLVGANLIFAIDNLGAFLLLSDKQGFVYMTLGKRTMD